MTSSLNNTITWLTERVRQLLGNRRFIIGAASVLAVILLIMLIGALSSDKDDAISSGRIGVATRGEMLINSIEMGSIQVEQKKEIQNDLQWKVIITEVVDDGTTVKEGDTIIIFECKQLMDALAKQRLDVTSAKNLWFIKVTNLELYKDELADKVQKARQGIIDAKEDMKRFEEGEWPIKLDEATQEVQLKKAELIIAQGDLEFKKEANVHPDLKDNPPYSGNEIEADQLKVDRLTLQVKKAESELRMLEKYDYPRDTRDYETKVSDAELVLKRAASKEKTEILAEEAEVNSRKSRLDMLKAELEKLEEDAAKLIVKADRAGLVIYKTTRRHWQQSNVSVSIGEEINQRQLLMIIPDMTSLKVVTKVPEAIINHIKVGQEAIVKLDARPGEIVKGKVRKIPPMPDQRNRWDFRNTKYYTIDIEINPECLDGLLPEMTADVELILDRLDDVLQVPIAAVFSEADEKFCWKVTDGSKRTKMPVTVGRTNDTNVEILSGIEEGDKVLLVPPEGLIDDGRDRPAAKPTPDKNGGE